MKRFFAYAMLACTLLVAGCSKPDNGNSGISKFSSSRDVIFSADINRFDVKSTDTAFENGDQIGIFAGAPIVKNNVKATIAGTKVTVDAASPICWLKDQTEATKFVGYYPYAASVANPEALEFAVAADQSAEGAYAASDLMVANVTANPPASETDPAVVNLNFKHVLSKVVIKIDNQLTSEVKSVSLTGAARDAKFNLLSAGAEVASSTGAAAAIKAVKGANDGTKLVYQLLTVPQTAQPQIKVEAADGATYVYSLASAFTFAPGKKYTADIAITAETVAGEVSFTLQVTDWEDAAENPVFGGQEVVIPVWEVLGTINGSAWDTPFAMTKVEAGENNFQGKWEYTIEKYNKGEVFKFRFGGLWKNEGGYEAGMPLTYDPIGFTTECQLNGEIDENKDIQLADACDGKKVKLVFNANNWQLDVVDMTE